MRFKKGDQKVIFHFRNGEFKMGASKSRIIKLYFGQL